MSKFSTFFVNVSSMMDAFIPDSIAYVAIPFTAAFILLHFARKQVFFMFSKLLDFIGSISSSGGSGGFSHLLEMLIFSMSLGLLSLIIGMLSKVKSAGLFGQAVILHEYIFSI